MTTKQNIFEITMYTFQCFFFWAWKRKWAWKPILDLFLHFFTCKVSVSRPLFLAFFTFFTPNLSFFTGTYRLFWYFFTGTKKKNHGHTSENFHVLGLFFHVHYFTRENWKCPTKRFLILFLVFFSPTFFYFSRAVWSFLGHIFKFFLGLHLIFLRLKFMNLMVFLCF